MCTQQSRFIGEHALPGDVLGFHHLTSSLFPFANAGRVKLANTILCDRSALTPPGIAPLLPIPGKSRNFRLCPARTCSARNGPIHPCPSLSLLKWIRAFPKP